MEEDKTPNGTFTQVPNMFLDTCELPETAQILFLRLLRYYGHTGGVFMGSVRKLANLVHMSKSTVDRMSKKLRDAHLIEMEYQTSQETEQEVMVIKLKLEDLWNANRHHCKIAPVPNWDSTLPNWDSVTQSGTEHPNVGQDVPGLSANSAQEDSKKILNTDNTMKTDSSLDITPEIDIFWKNWLACKYRNPKSSTSLAKHLAKVRDIAQHGQTPEELDKYCLFAISMLPTVNDGLVHIANLYSCRVAWDTKKSEQSQQVPEQQSDDTEQAANVYELTRRVCKFYGVRPPSYRKTMLDLFQTSQASFEVFEQWVQQAQKQSETIEVFLRQLERHYEKEKVSQTL